MINLLRWSTRLAGLGALVLGVLFWRGMFTRALHIHMALGGIVALVLVIMAVCALVARVRIPLAIVSVVWAAATVYVGLTQEDRLVIEIVHLLLGVGAVGMAEALGGAIGRRKTLLGEA
jgi:hypothetical protein